MNKILESDPNIMAGARKILFELGNLQSHEKLCIITDFNTSKVGKIFLSLAKNINTSFFEIKPLQIHGEEPPDDVVISMNDSDLILGLTYSSMAHTKARFFATENGARYLSLPNYSPSLLADNSLKADFFRLSKKTKLFSDLLNKHNILKIKNKNGTDIQLDLSNRISNYCPGFVNNEISLGSPPDIEVNIAPNENKSNGKIVVDASIPIQGLGKLSSPIVLTIHDGKIISIDGNNEEKKILDKIFQYHGENSKFLAEFGIGFNENASLCGNMLIDEGTYGTIHFGFGSNDTIGGKNSSSTHIDFVVYCNEIELDGKKIII